MLASAPNNCNLPSEWALYLQRGIDMSSKKSQAHKHQGPFLLGEAPRRKKQLWSGRPSQMPDEQRTLQELNGKDRAVQIARPLQQGLQGVGRR
jgi:hypothetical protein